MRSPKIEISPITLIIYACFLVSGVLVAYTLIALPTMINETAIASKKNEIQRTLRDAYNSATQP